MVVPPPAVLCWPSALLLRRCNPMAFRSKHLHAAVLLGLGILIGIGLSLGPTVQANKTVDTSTAMPWKDARLMAQVMERVKQDYVDPVSDDQLVKNALKGMLAG